MELHDPYRAPSRSVASQDPAQPVDMSEISFGGDGLVADAATIAAGYSSSIIALRWLASIIDFVALAVIYGVPAVVMGNRMPNAGKVLVLVLMVAYFPVMEAVFGGAVGKLATGTRVVNLRGGRPAWWQAIVRTLLRAIEVNPFMFGGLPAGLMVLFNGRRQRLGDLLARTYVLRRADIARIRPAGTPQPAPPGPAALPVQD